MPEPVSASPLARAGATAGSLAAAGGVAAYHWGSLTVTQLLATGAVGVAAVLLHVRHTAAQMAARALWMASGLTALLNLGVGPARERFASAIVLTGSSVALWLMGRSGLQGGLPGAFEPARYRAPLLVSLALASGEALRFALSGLVILEGWGFFSDNLLFAAGLGIGVYGLARMRTWGLLFLAAMLSWIVGSAFFGRMHLPAVLKGVHGVSALAALVGLAPMLALAAKKLLRDEVTASPERVRIATSPVSAAGGAVTRLSDESDAETEALAVGDRLASRDTKDARRSHLDRDRRADGVRA